MDFDFDKFLYIAAWVVAVGATLISIAGVFGMYYYHNTTSGKLELIRLRMKRQVPSYRWSVLFVAIIAWIAVFSFN